MHPQGSTDVMMASHNTMSVVRAFVGCETHNIRSINDVKNTQMMSRCRAQRLVFAQLMEFDLVTGNEYRAEETGRLTSSEIEVYKYSIVSAHFAS